MFHLVPRTIIGGAPPVRKLAIEQGNYLTPQEHNVMLRAAVRALDDRHDFVSKGLKQTLEFHADFVKLASVGGCFLVSDLVHSQETGYRRLIEACLELSCFQSRAESTRFAYQRKGRIDPVGVDALGLTLLLNPLFKFSEVSRQLSERVGDAGDYRSIRLGWRWSVL
jgi:hypothetical protein